MGPSLSAAGLLGITITGDAFTSPYTGTQGASSELFGFRDGHHLDIGFDLAHQALDVEGQPVAGSVVGWEAERPAEAEDRAVPLLGRLRADGLRVGVLSNTLWPRAWHESFFARDGILDLIDGAVYTSEVPWTKPAPEAFRAAMDAVGVADPGACVFVGDRPFDDIWGAARAGMRTILVPHSEIPAQQVGHSVGEPDAVAHRLHEVHGIVSAWR